MEIKKFGEVVVFANGRVEVNGWSVIGGSAPQLRRFAIRKALWDLFKAWLSL